MAYASGPAQLDTAPAPAWSTAEFAEVYRAQFEFVWSQLRRLGVDESSLEDAAQEVFVVVHRRLDEFAGRSALRTWLFAIARRVAFRFRRSAARRFRRHQALARQSLAPAYPDPDEAIRHGQARRLLAAFLQQLDGDKRAAFLLGELEGLGRAELGQALGINPNTAYARLRAAREQFDRAFVSPSARAAILSEARAPTPPSAAQRLRVWALVGLGLGADRALVATSTTAATTGGLKLLLVAGILSVLSVMLIETGMKGHVTVEPERPPSVVASPPRAVATSAPPPALTGAVAVARADEDDIARAPASSARPGRREAPRGDRRSERKVGVAPMARETSEAQLLADSAEVVPLVAETSEAQFPGESAVEPASAPPVLRPRSREQDSAPPPSTSGPEPARAAADAALAEDVRLLGEARRALASGAPGRRARPARATRRAIPGQPARRHEARDEGVGALSSGRRCRGAARGRGVSAPAPGLRARGAGPRRLRRARSMITRAIAGD
ncbi:sigma-70 family RNA polymerase sigma factor [Nannocystis radixulma]|uniref:Sigma-70 family RNA polymerase sigma factor n=1 Tax=Nannocystis radixulma TaxID=2995305 RepID=A0ABT5BH38_9BACT|nr:sigma-70 family RNA polymerase sigma factor [Nannocystis radixulma]MDC0673472.1 sigma-70 family RNA polymerase sigma factor [Nannocystis radixulma]